MPGEALTLGQELLIGYYGKVPTNGDFVLRRLPRSFVDPWDSWLQRAIAISREQLADAWLDSYLTSPLWRFVLSAGLCGEQTAAGVLMPSVDSVGRYFPMTIAALPAAPCNPFGLAAGADGWFSQAEEAALSCLDEGFQLEAFEARLAELPILADATPGARPSPPSAGGGLGWSFDDPAIEALCPAVYPALLDDLTRDRLKRYSIWWTSGSDLVPATFKIHEGLPPEADFASFLHASEA